MESETRARRTEPRRVYSSEFKLRLVELATRPDANVADIARTHGVNDNVLLNGSVCGVKKAGYSAGCQLPFHLYPLLRHFRSKLYLTPPPGGLRLCLVRERGQPAR